MPSHLPLQSCVPIRVGMFASSPWHLGNVLGCCETPAAHAVTLVVVTLVKTCSSMLSIFLWGRIFKCQFSQNSVDLNSWRHFPFYAELL